MSELDNHTKRIMAKLQQLLKQYQQLEKENRQLMDKLKQKHEESQTVSTKISDLEQQVTLLKAVTGKMEGADKTALEKNINKHLKEIDRCITFLSE